MTIETECRVYSTATKAALWVWASTFGNTYAAATPIAQLASGLSASLVLTTVANTSAATNPASLTASKSILSPDQNFQVIFNSVDRTVPLRWDVLTTDSAGTGSLFATT